METLRDILTRIQTDVATALTLVPVPVETQTGTFVRAGEDLQAALDKGGLITLEDNATFEGAFVVRVSGTTLRGPLSHLHSPIGAPALTVPAGVHDVVIRLGNLTTVWDQVCLQLGDNYISRQEDLPYNITATVTIPTHRGKRAIEVSARDVVLENCTVKDCWDAARRDSQAILVLNTTGNVRVSGGYFEAGSENIMVGGAPTGITTVVPTNLVFEDLTLVKPLSWKTDGVNRNVKNLFELKSGVDVTLRRSVLDGSWIASQVGWAVMLTPREGKRVGNVLLEDLTIKNAGGGVSILGQDNNMPGPAVENVTLRRVTCTMPDGFGTGRFVQWTAEPRNITITGCTSDGPAQIIYAAIDGVKWVNGVLVQAAPITEGVSITENTFRTDSYGISVNGNVYGRFWQEGLPGGVIERNVLHGSTAEYHRNYLPGSNTYQA